MLDNLDETRALRKKCSCGRFNVRRKFIVSADTKYYKTDKGDWNPYRPSVPHPDGLCSRCATYGSPKHMLLNTTGGIFHKEQQRGDTARARKSLENIDLCIREGEV